MKKILAMLLAVVMVLALCACGQSSTGEANPNDSDANTETSKGTPKEPYNDEETLRIAFTSEITALDPIVAIDTYSTMVYSDICETLMKLDENGNVVCDLAESYEQLDDVTYVFTIPQGVKFHNGEELKASDIKFCLERGRDSETLAAFDGDIDYVEIVDDYTVKIHLKQLSASFLSNLTCAHNVIYSQKAVEEYGDDYYKNPVGTGPYKLDEWNMGVDVKLSYFEDYHGEAPDFKYVTIVAIPEDTNRVIELEAGSVDFITAPAATDLDRISNTEGLALYSTAGTATRFMGMNCSAGPLKDPRVRQAIAYAIDVDAVNQAVNLGYCTTAKSCISPAVMFYDDCGANEYNPEKARELLAEAGYADGLTLTISTDTRKLYDDMATIIQSQLAEVGITIKLNFYEWATYLADVYAGNTELFIIGWGSTTLDPDGMIYNCFHSSMHGQAGNISFLSDDLVDQYIIEGRSTTDTAARAEAYKKLQARLGELRPWVYVFNATQYVAVNSEKIANVCVDPVAIHRFYKVEAVK